MSTNTPTQRLGKGLEALIPKTYFASGRTISNIPLAEIQPNPYQPRKTFHDESLQGLVESIKAHGVAQPILVRRVGNYYELIAGERRFRASKLAGLETIPAIIRNMSDKESLEMALIENLQREDLNAIETAKGYLRLIEEFNLTHQELSLLFGKSRSGISNSLRLLSLPETIQTSLINAELTEGHVRPLLGLKTESQMLECFDVILKNQYSVRETENLIANYHGEIASQAESGDPLSEKTTVEKTLEKNQYFETLSVQLSNFHQLKIAVKGQLNKGKIEIKFSNEAEFKRIQEFLTTQKG